MKQSERELVELTEKWMGKISEITIKYERAIGVLKDAKDRYESQTKKWHQILLNYLPYILPFVVIFALGIMLNHMPYNSTINTFNVIVTRSCVIK